MRLFLALSVPVALPALLVVASLAATVAGGCSGTQTSDENGLDGATGGALPTGGQPSGGQASGGQPSGGQPSGGTTGTGGASSGGSGSGGSDAAYPPLEECATPSVDRLQKWWGTGEGPTIPGADQSLLVAEGAGYVAHVEFASAPQWHVAPVWIANAYAGVDVSTATELRIVYSATSDLWVQLRPESTFSGGNKWHHLLPATGGEFSTLVVPLDAASWVEKLGTPPGTVAEALTELLALVFVGNTNNVVTVQSLRIQGYTPPCL